MSSENVPKHATDTAGVGLPTHSATTVSVALRADVTLLPPVRPRNLAGTLYAVVAVLSVNLFTARGFVPSGDAESSVDGRLVRDGPMECQARRRHRGWPRGAQGWRG